MSRIPEGATGPDRAVAVVGAGALTALAALLIMFGAYGFDSASPRADNIGEEGIGILFGVIGWVLGLVAALLAGVALSRGSARGRGWSWLLPPLVSVVWMLLAQAAIHGRWFESLLFGAWPVSHSLPSEVGMTIWPLFVTSVATFGALPMLFVFLVAWIVLLIVRMIRRR